MSIEGVRKRTMWDRVREEGIKRPKLLTTPEMRGETMKQIVLQELGHFVDVHDFGNRLIKFNRDGVDEKSIVIVWKAGLLEHAGTVLTLAWDDDNTSLCADDPGDTTFKYVRELSLQYSDTECFGDQYGHLHFKLTKKLLTSTEWHAQFWPFVKVMIMMVFKHSMLRATVAVIYGDGNVFNSRPVYAERGSEVWLMRMHIGTPGRQGINLSFEHHRNTPVVHIRPDPPAQVDDARLIAIITGISRINIQQSASRFFIAKTSRSTCWRVCLRFQSQADMDAILQAVKILKQNDAF